MYDKVKMWLDRTNVGEQLSYIPNYLDEATTHYTHKTGEERVSGSLGGLRVVVGVNGLSVLGSLPKFLYGNNVAPLDRQSTIEVMEKISNCLRLPIDNAKITELEFGYTFAVRHPVESYLSRLGIAPRLKRLQCNTNTLYYRGRGHNPTKELSFYDKRAEMARERENIPIDATHLLRYEMKLHGRLPQQLGIPAVTASTLTESDTYRMLVRRWQDFYFAITKQVAMADLHNIKTPKEAKEVLIARLIMEAGQERIDAFLQELRNAQVFDNRNNYTRLKKQLMGGVQNTRKPTSDELIRELDNEVKNCGCYI